MPKGSSVAQNIEIDRLTDCIIHIESGKEFATKFTRIIIRDLNGVKMKKGEWQFNWRKEVKTVGRTVYKLTTINDPYSIQGLVSIEDKQDHHYLHLVESAPINFAREKVHEGVAANLFALCCKLSKDNGNFGFIAFQSKTVLLQHYQTTLGALPVGGQNMIIYPDQALILINKYFKK